MISKTLIIIALKGTFLYFLDANITLFLYDKIFVNESKLHSNFHQKKIWITGASSGIGLELAHRLASQGAILVLSARNENKLQSLAKEFQSLYDNHDTMIVPFDMRANPQTLETTIDKILHQMGGIDILILNAGYFQEGSSLLTTPQLRNDIMQVNYYSPVHLAMELIHRDQWKTKKKGHIVVTSSAYGFVPAPYSAAYSATKHAINGFFHVLRVESTSWNLKITLACPGPIQTNIHHVSNKAKNVQHGGGSVYQNNPFNLSVERCVQLMLSGMVGPSFFFTELWILKNLGVIYLYLHHYIPVLGNFASSLISKITAMYHDEELNLW